MTSARVYTRGGDGGTSQLLSVGRVPKDHLRLAVYGDTDELNGVLGLAIAGGLVDPLSQQLAGVQRQLFVLGSEIAVPRPDEIGFDIPAIQPVDADNLERWIDALDHGLPPLRNFILPGGACGAARLHVARTVCRRLERDLQSLHRAESVSAAVLAYVNRLSDYLFTAARHENRGRGVADVEWRSGRETG